MNAWPRSSARFAVCGVAALALTTAPLAAAPTTATATYVVQSIVDGPNGSLTANEMLNVAWSNGRAAITLVQQTTGETAHVAAPIDANGVLDIATADPALACYNAAQGILAGTATTQTATPLAVSLAGNALTIPLHLAAASKTNGMQAFTIGGRVEGTFDALPQTGIAIVVDGSVLTQQRQLVSIRLRQTTVVAATRAPLAQTSCSMARVLTAQPGLPA